MLHLGTFLQIGDPSVTLNHEQSSGQIELCEDFVFNESSPSILYNSKKLINTFKVHCFLTFSLNCQRVLTYVMIIVVIVIKTAPLVFFPNYKALTFTLLVVSVCSSVCFFLFLLLSACICIGACCINKNVHYFKK